MVYREQLVIVPAEKLPGCEAAEAIRKYNARRKPAGVFHSAWSHVEYALNDDAGIDDDLRQEYFDIAQSLLGGVIVDARTHRDMRFEALVLSSYIPIFQKRRFREQVTPQDCMALYDSIGAALELLRPLKIDEPPQSIMMEAACEALAARSLQPANLLYPTSPREESSPYVHFNHDSYFFADTGDKVPLQQKLQPTSKRYDDPVRVLTLLPLLDKAARRARIEFESASSERVNYLLGLIVAETHGKAVAKNEKQLLDYMTRSIIAHRRSQATLIAA